MAGTFRGALEINIPNISESVDEFQYKWKFTVILKDTASPQRDDLTFIFESNSFSKVPERDGGMNYILSKNIFTDGYENNVEWAFYEYGGSVGTYYNSFTTMMNYFESYLEEQSLDDYQVAKFTIVEIKFKTLANSESTRDWTDWIDVTEEFQNISLFDNFSYYDGTGNENVTMYCSELGTSVDVQGNSNFEISNTDINFGGVSKLTSVYADVFNTDLLSGGICLPIKYFYDIVTAGGRDDVSENDDDGMLSDINMSVDVDYYGSDLTEDVFPNAVYYEYTGDNANNFVLDVYDYTTEFEPGTEFIFTFTYNGRKIINTTGIVQS